MAYLFLGIGIACLVIAVAMVIRSGIVKWLLDHTGKVSADRLAEAGDDFGLRNYPRGLRDLKVALPLLFLGMGMILIGFSAASLLS